ncbi:hypothetical protein N9L33_06335 [Nitrospinae bacterium]|jgi:hypothetical protein|nr:hypothetical protein [Nitrospinota bacterium]
MLQKLKITTYVFILCLFGLTLITVSPIFAEDSAAIDKCEKMSKHRRGKRFVRSTDQISCYKSLVRELTARVNKLESEEGPVYPRVDDDASAIRMGTESNENGRYGTSYRHELRENNRMRNGIPGSGRKMK